MIRVQASRWKIALSVVIAAVLILIYWPALRWMVLSWISSDYYSHGFLVPLVSAFFIWTKREYLKIREPSIIGIFWMVLGAALYISGFFWQIRFMGILSLLCVIAGLVFAIFGTRTARALIFPLAFLLFMVPFKFIQDLAYLLQYLSVHLAAWISQALQLPIKTAGTQIYLGDNITFTVGVVCSGINTLIALLALAAVYTHVQKGSVASRTGLFILALPLAVLANILRIVSIILVAYFVDVNTATGWYHDLSSPLFFFIAFLVLILIGRAMKFQLNYEILGSNKTKHP